MRLITFTILVFCASIGVISAQSPIDLPNNVGADFNTWAQNVNTVSDIESVFTDARRLEEAALNLPNNSLGNLTLPANWTSLSADERMLILLNAERTCRGGVDYGSGAVLGLPFAGVETAVDMAAQSHADQQVAANTFSHTGSNNTSPFDRIENAVGTNCRSFMSYGENLASSYAIGGQNNDMTLLENAVFRWIYRDASSNWGHRRALLIQDTDIYGGTGFTNDYGDAGSEGFIGVGLASSSSYTGGANIPNITDGDLVVFKVFDPVPSCTYNIVVTSTEVLPVTASAISVYPNPNNGQFTLEGVEIGATYRLINSLGQVVQTQIILDNTTQINAANLSKGMYWVEVEQKGKRQVGKVIVH